MPIEKSAGTVIFTKENGKIYYLLLHYPGRAQRRIGDEGKLQKRQTSSTDSQKDYWDFPKGHIEKGETLESTALREAV
jgi:8-oxo-dGTP pyrophosphatase MutT (NUDIX family)